jgi:hypothetical protein
VPQSDKFYFAPEMFVSDCVPECLDSQTHSPRFHAVRTRVRCIHIHAVYSVSGAFYLPSGCLECLMDIEIAFTTRLTRL